MADEVARQTGLPPDTSIVELALSELVEAGLIELDGPPAQGLTRRSVMRSLALSAAAAAILRSAVDAPPVARRL